MFLFQNHPAFSSKVKWVDLHFNWWSTALVQEKRGDSNAAGWRDVVKVHFIEDGAVKPFRSWRLHAGVVSDVHHFMLWTMSLGQEGGAKREKIELANEQLAATELCSQQGQQAPDGLVICSPLCLCFNLSLYWRQFSRYKWITLNEYYGRVTNMAKGMAAAGWLKTTEDLSSGSTQ